MLDNRKAKPYNENKVVTIVGPGTRINGELLSKGTIRVEGEISGHVRCEDSVVVQQSGKVHADIVAGQVIVSGEVQGNIYAQDRLEITATGKVVGDVTAPRVSFAEGMLLEGKCTTKAPAPPPRPGKKDSAEKPAAPVSEAVSE